MAVLTEVRIDDLKKLLETLFPIHRSLLGKGYRESLDVIREYLPLELHDYPSGMNVFDWTIPDEWNVTEAFLEDMRGNRIVDFRDCNYHVMPYSDAFSGVVSRDELLARVHVHPELPDAIPLVQAYYQRKWGLCMSQRTRDSLTEPRYRVHIGAEFSKGVLRIGECVVPGETDREVILSTYLCHPRGANDNLSGVVTATGVFKELLKRPKPRYSYRLIIVPETIGSITWIATHKHLLGRIIGGYTMVCNGTAHPVTYKRSYQGDAVVDRAVGHLLKHRGKRDRIVDFFRTKGSGSDERQFNSPGVRLPVGSILRAPYAEYPEYHTNLDDLSLLSDEALLDTIQLTVDALDVIDRDRRYKLNCEGGEPFLTKYNLVDVYNRHTVLLGRMIQELNGDMSLLQIAEKWDYPFAAVKEVAESFVTSGVCSEVKDE